jgi:uncharacterized membrane protein YcjF (UPF0283 family)
MSQSNKKHVYQKPTPAIISTDQSHIEPNHKQPKKQATPRSGQPQNVGVYKKPTPEILTNEPKPYVAEKNEPHLDESVTFKLPKIVNLSLLIVILILIIFVFNQVASLYIQLANLPTWSKTIGYFFLALLFILLVYSFLSFLRLFLKLKTFEQQSFTELNQRALTIKSSHSMQATKAQLKKFVETYAIDQSQFSEPEMAQLLAAQDELIHREYGDSLAWIEAYKNEFQSILDQKANEMVSNYAKKVGWNTAIIPNGFLDSIVVFYMNIQMIKSLSILYHIRIGKVSSIRLFIKVFIHTFGARYMEEITDTMLEDGSKIIFQGATNIFTAKLGSKVTEGVVNYYFTNRIGKRCIHYLQPLNK